MATQIEKAAEEYAEKFYKPHKSLRKTSFLAGASAQSKIDRDAMKGALGAMRRQMAMERSTPPHLRSAHIQGRINQLEDAINSVSAALKLTEKQ